MPHEPSHDHAYGRALVHVGGRVFIRRVLQGAISMLAISICLKRWYMYLHQHLHGLHQSTQSRANENGSNGTCNQLKRSFSSMRILCPFCCMRQCRESKQASPSSCVQKIYLLKFCSIYDQQPSAHRRLALCPDFVLRYSILL